MEKIDAGELLKKCSNDAIKALVPLLDNEETQQVGTVLLKALDLGLSTLQMSQHDPEKFSQVQQQAGVQVQQVKVRDVEQEERVQGLVDDTLKELQMMDNHESNPTTVDKDGNEVEYVKGMLCNCQFASEFHKYCDNQCKEIMIKAQGDPKEYVKFIEKERGVQDTKSLDEAMDDVTDFIDTELGIKVSPRPQQQMQQQSQQPQQQPQPMNSNEHALDPSKPVVMPGQEGTQK